MLQTPKLETALTLQLQDEAVASSSTSKSSNENGSLFLKIDEETIRCVNSANLKDDGGGRQDVPVNESYLIEDSDQVLRRLYGLKSQRIGYRYRPEREHCC